MAKPVVSATTLVTEDGVPIDAIHLPGTGDLAIVVAHGFTLSWQRPNVWRIANRFNQMAGVLTFDFRGHGRSGGLCTPARLQAGRRGRLLDGCVDRLAARRPGRRARRGGVGQRPRPVVLPGHRTDAAGALRGGTPDWPVRHQTLAEDPDQPGGLEAAPRPPGRGGGADLARPAADRAR